MQSCPLIDINTLFVCTQVDGLEIKKIGGGERELLVDLFEFIFLNLDCIIPCACQYTCLCHDTVGKPNAQSCCHNITMHKNRFEHPPLVRTQIYFTCS